MGEPNSDYSYPGTNGSSRNRRNSNPSVITTIHTQDDSNHQSSSKKDCCYGCDNTDFALWNAAAWGTKQVYHAITYVPEITCEVFKHAWYFTKWLCGNPVNRFQWLTQPFGMLDSENGIKDYRTVAMVGDAVVQAA